MDSLPDEMLLLILGSLDDGLVLLDAVPRVCKRWHRVARDHRAWASVAVTVPGCSVRKKNRFYENGDGDEYVPCDDDILAHREIADAARVILHAPCLRRLRINWIDSIFFEFPLNCPSEERVVRSALRRSSATVQELQLRYPPHPRDFHYTKDLEDSDDLDVLLDFMAKSRRSLRVLGVGRLLELPKVELAVSQLAELESLSLTCGQLFELTGQLEGGLLNLKRLEVIHTAHCELWNATALVAVLVRGAAGRLRQLHFRGGFGPLPPAVAAEVRRCEGLRELGCGVADLAVLPALPQLRSLAVNMGLGYPFSYGSDEVTTWLASVTEVLKKMGPLKNLRHLKVELCLRSRCTAYRPSVEALLKALASAASDATALDSTEVDPALSELLLERLPRLRSVMLHHCAPRTLARLAGLPELEELKLNVLKLNPFTLMNKSPTVLPGLDEEAAEGMAVRDALSRMRRLRSVEVHGCSAGTLAVLAQLPELEKLTAGVVYSRGEGDCCRAAIDEFRRQRPDVSADLNCYERWW